MTSSYEILPNDQQTKKYPYPKRQHFSHLGNFQTYRNTLDTSDIGIEL